MNAFFKSVPTVEADRLILRLLTLEDAEYLFSKPWDHWVSCKCSYINRVNQCTDTFILV